MRVSTHAQIRETSMTDQQKNESVLPNKVTPENSLKQLMKAQQAETADRSVPKEKVQKAIDALNTLQTHNSKFIMHEGLDKYYVQVVDAKTEEVIREIPPRKLLDAFYTMQKILGMIVDEKI
ncbi:flagellar protein FlaG [Chungangia koreensis]|uniref:Flagellar protein FlaG n=1 Tax=Chungangia koreensis TaxID=752657 RepID=A0ABV8X4L4_9LACT